jgi:hypothetical protein
MGDAVGDFIGFWHGLRVTESVPKEYLMEIADAKDPTTLSMLIMLDKEAAHLKELRREAEARKNK